MILPGEKMKLRIKRILPQGAYLAEEDDSAKGDEVLLPGKQVPEGAAPGDETEVFIYRDSKDRLISTTAEPLIVSHEVARLKVREVTKIGAFLDMGLERDLLLPFAEQTSFSFSMYRDPLKTRSRLSVRFCFSFSPRRAPYLQVF